MELAQRYILEVGTYLPKDLREDVSEALRSRIAAALEARQAADTTTSLEDHQVAILQELGPPHQFADAYVPRPRVLFGPRLYPAFFRTLKIAIAVLVALAALGVYFDFARSQSLLSLGPSLLTAFTSILTGSLVVVGIAVVVFAVIERQTDAPSEDDEKWDPRTLPEAEDPDKISLGDQVSSIAFLLVALLVVNLFRDRIGAHFTFHEESGWVPLLGPAFDARLWLLNLALALDLLVNFIVLARWRWSWPLRIANFAVNCLYVVWLQYLVSHPPLIAANPEWMVRNGWSADAAAEYQEFIASNFALWINRNVTFVLWAACLGLAYSLFKLVRRMFVRP